MALKTCPIQKSSLLMFLVRGETNEEKQLASRPDDLWPEIWKSMGKHAKLKEKAKVV